MKTLSLLSAAVLVFSAVSAPLAEAQAPAPAPQQDPGPRAGGRPGPPPRQGGGPPRGGPPPAGAWVEESFNGRAALGVRGTVDLTAARGDITVSGVDGNFVRVAAVKRVLEQNKDFARTVLQNVRIPITQRGGGVEILTEVPEGKLPPMVVDYQVGVPYSASVTLRSLGGAIRVENVKGELRVEALGDGDMTLTGVGRVRLAKSAGGSVAIEGAEGDEVSAETFRGRLQIASVRARTVELRSISGPVVVTDTLCDRCTINTVGGSIDFSGPLKADARYSLNTTSGDIRLMPTGTVSFDLDAMTAGTLVSEFQLRSGRSPAPSPGARGRILRGVYGTGSSILSLRSFTGNVSVLRKQ